MLFPITVLEVKKEKLQQKAKTEKIPEVKEGLLRLIEKIDLAIAELSKKESENK